MNRSLFVLVPFLVALSGCGTPQPLADVPGMSAVTRAELGTGQLYWEPLSPSGTHVELIHGPQGGYHVFGRLRFDAPSADVYIRFRATLVDGGAVLNDPNDRLHLIEGRGITRTATGWETSSALLIVLANIRGPADVVGRNVRIEATITPSPGTPETPSATVSRNVTVVDKT